MRRVAMIVPHGHRAGLSNPLAMAYLRLLRPQDAAHFV